MQINARGFLRFLCALIVMLAAIPASSIEAICIVPNQPARPMGKCGMPCCAHPAPVVAKPKCCKSPRGTTITRHQDGHCETRVKSTTSPTRISPTTPNVQIDLTELDLNAPAPVITRSEADEPKTPGIRGQDEGPPDDPTRTAPNGRAPPAR